MHISYSVPAGFDIVVGYWHVLQVIHQRFSLAPRAMRFTCLNQVHCKKVRMAHGVDLGSIARSTSGFSGAELANVVNEAAMYAAR